MFSIIALAHGLDITLHDLIHIDFVQSVVIVAYTVSEFGSVIKNLEKAGLGGIVPPVLRYILYAINISKSEPQRLFLSSFMPQRKRTKSNENSFFLTRKNLKARTENPRLLMTRWLSVN